MRWLAPCFALNRSLRRATGFGLGVQGWIQTQFLATISVLKIHRVAIFDVHLSFDDAPVAGGLHETVSQLFYYVIAGLMACGCSSREATSLTDERPLDEGRSSVVWSDGTITQMVSISDRTLNTSLMTFRRLVR